MRIPMPQRQTAPHVRAEGSAMGMQGDIILMLFFLYTMPTIFFGPRVPLCGLLSAALCYLCDLGCQLLRRRRNPRDLSGVVTGLMIPLLLPASIPFGVVLAAGLFAILVVKHPFGGLGQNPFNPAAGGLACVSVTAPDLVFRYPMPAMPTTGWLPLFGTVETALASGSAEQLQSGSMPAYEPVDLLRGFFPGPVGTTCTLLVIGCLLYLLARRTVTWHTPVAFLGTVAICAFLFPRLASGDRLDSMIYELLSGAAVFGAAILMGDPVTTPRIASGRLLYGMIGGATLMALRHFGAYPQGMVFAVLIANAFSPMLDELTARAYTRRYRRLGQDAWEAEERSEDIEAAGRTDEEVAGE